MSISSLGSTATPSSTSGHTARTELSERIDAGASSVGSTLSNVAGAAADGVSATVSFSGRALHALEHAGEAVVDGVEDAAVGAWHAVQSAAAGVEHFGESVVDAVEGGVDDVVSTAKSAARELGHYASVGLDATGNAAGDIASDGVLAASAVGKTVMAMV